MNKDIQRKNVIFYSIFLIITLIVFDLFYEPANPIRIDFVQKGIEKMTSKQNIAPQRLFINAWRITRNSYVDETLNNQDWLRWRYRYAGHIKTLDDANVAINSMLSSLNDPYTKFLRSDLFSKQKIILDSKITGVGILFNKSGDEIVINHVLENSPAQAANIAAGDTIVGINGVKAKDLDMDKLIEKIESSKTGFIELTVKHKDEIVTTKLKKKDIPLKTMNYEVTKNNIGIITLSNIMGERAVSDFKDILEKTNNTKAVIIDLRDNYGGILANAIQMANYMLDVDKILSIKSRINEQYQIYSADENIFKRKPVVILINKNTASAAEILAGTLKDNLNAVLIGEKSFGKNSIQQVMPMSNGTGLILTTDKYILPSGLDIYNKGLVPDIEIIQNSAEYGDMGLKKALELLNGAAAS